MEEKCAVNTTSQIRNVITASKCLFSTLSVYSTFSRSSTLSFMISPTPCSLLLGKLKKARDCHNLSIVKFIVTLSDAKIELPPLQLH